MVGRDKKLTSNSKVDLTHLPPSHSALKPHVWHVNHHVALYKWADEHFLERPKTYDNGQGWIRTDNAVLEPVWSCGPVLTNSLVDLPDNCEEEEKDEFEFDFDDFSESDNHNRHIYKALFQHSLLTALYSMFL